MGLSRPLTRPLPRSIARGLTEAGSGGGAFDPYINQIPVVTGNYSAGDGYRIATLSKVSENHILLVCQNVRVPSISTDVQNARLVAIDLTLNPFTKIMAVSDTRVILTYRGVPAPSRPGETAYAANPTALRLTSGANAGRIVIFHTSNVDNPDTLTPTKAYEIHSDDGGVTWSAPVHIPAFDATAGGAGEGWAFASGPQAIQLQRGAFAGRIVVPGYVYTSGGYGRFVCGYSDDNMATWSFSTRGAAYSDETAIVEAADGTIYASSRTNIVSRDLYASTNGAASFVMVNDAYLPDPICNGSMLMHGGKILTASDIDTPTRTNLNIRSSTGVPDVFDANFQVDSSFAGYSAMEAFNSRDALLVYEDNQKYIAADGSIYNTGTSLVGLSAMVFNIGGLDDSAGSFETTQPALAAAPTYAEYAARVVADGGEVMDPVACADAFAFLNTNGIDTRQFIVGAKFGVRQISGIIQKVYSFDGNDLVPVYAAGSSGFAQGEGPFYDTTGANATIRCDNIVSFCSLKAQQPAPLAAAGASGFCLAYAGINRLNDAPNVEVFEAHPPGAANNYAALLSAFNGAYGVSYFEAAFMDSAYNPASAPSFATLEATNTGSTTYVDFAGFCTHVNMSSSVIKTYLDGTQKSTITAAPGIYDYRATSMERTIPATYNGSLTLRRGFAFAEFWGVNNCTDTFAAALSARLGTLY